jgi:hypothetical protein
MFAPWKVFQVISGSNKSGRATLIGLQFPRQFANGEVSDQMVFCCHECESCREGRRKVSSVRLRPHRAAQVDLLVLRQCEGDDGIALLLPVDVWFPSGAYNDELLAIRLRLIGHRRGVGTRGKLRFPRLLAGLNASASLLLASRRAHGIARIR